jgi:hypothetical protein
MKLQAQGLSRQKRKRKNSLGRYELKHDFKFVKWTSFPFVFYNYAFTQHTIHVLNIKSNSVYKSYSGHALIYTIASIGFRWYVPINLGVGYMYML